MEHSPLKCFCRLQLNKALIFPELKRSHLPIAYSQSKLDAILMPNVRRAMQTIGANVGQLIIGAYNMSCVYRKFPIWPALCANISCPQITITICWQARIAGQEVQLVPNTSTCQLGGELNPFFFGPALVEHLRVAAPVRCLFLWSDAHANLPALSLSGQSRA